MRTKIAGVDKRVTRHVSSASCEMPALISEATLNNTAWTHSLGERWLQSPLGMAEPSLHVARMINGYFRRLGMTWEASYSIRGLYMGTPGMELATQFCLKKLMPRW